MATALFITEERLKSFTSIDENVEPQLLYPFVLQAQDLYLQASLGTKLYNEMKDLVVDNVVNGTPIPADYLTLLEDYIAPMLIHYAYYNALPSIKYRSTNKGLLSGTSEVATPVSLDELKYFRNSIFDSAKFYDERLREYLKAYSNLYPEYTTFTNLDGMPPKRSTSYMTGLVIPRRRYNNYFDDCDTTDGACNPTIY